MTKDEMRAAIRNVLYTGLPKEIDADVCRSVAEALLALIESVMKENELFREALIAIEREAKVDRVAYRACLDWIARAASAALSSKSEKQDNA
jgi:hypothetical protein